LSSNQEALSRSLKKIIITIRVEQLPRTCKTTAIISQIGNYLH
jgi:hypothetical protein